MLTIRAPEGRRPSKRHRRLRRLKGSLATWARQAVWPPSATAPSPEPRERLRCLSLLHFAPIALYAAIAVIVTFPLILHFGTHVPSDGATNAQNGDALQNYWDYWWAWRALRSGQNPYYSPLLYAPYGAPLYLHTLNLFNGLASIPIQIIFGMTPAYNTVILLSFTLAGYFAYLLAAHVSRSRLAGLAAGASYAFGSYHIMHLLGHTNLLASEWLPAYILCLLLATEATGRRRTILVLLAAGALLLLMLCDLQYALFGILFTVLFVAWKAIARRAVAPLAVAAAIGLLWAVAALPVIIPTMREVQHGVTEPPAMFGPGSAETYSADVWSFLVPSPMHSIWGAWAKQLQRHFTIPPVEGVVFLGYIPIVLALVGVALNWRRARFWLVMALAFLILALGPNLHINGVWRFGDTGWNFGLPFQLFGLLPGLNLLRVPVRFALLVSLCIGVLAALGLVGLARLVPPLARVGVRSVLLPVLLAGIVVEHIAVPFPLEAVPAAPFYTQLAASPEQGTILEWPVSLKRARSNYYQTIHGRPIIGGYVSRQLAYPLRALPPFRGTPEPNSDIFIRENAPELGAWALAYSNVHWIVVYLEDPRLDREGLAAFLHRYAEPTPLYADQQMAVYRPRPPSAPASFLEYGLPGEFGSRSDWYVQEEQPSDKRQFRWFKSKAAFAVWSFGASPQTYSLRFDAWSFHEPRRLDISVDGQYVGQWRVDGAQRFDIPLTLTNGQHRVELHSADPPISPASIGGSPKDTRSLAFAISAVELQRR